MSEVHFKTNILLKNIIGKDLITDDNIAVLEIVKNSFDAGSPIVELEFKNILPSNHINNSEVVSTLIISDKGVGMDQDGLINRWLNIAYSEKKEQSWMNGRRQAGSKGVGRFSCDRLGKRLSIFTKARGCPCLWLEIDWTTFEDIDAQNKAIQDVAFELKEILDDQVKQITGWDNFEQGTVLVISDLRERWNENKILRLKRDLEKFINPNQPFQNLSFSIKIKAEEFYERDLLQESEILKINGFVRNQVFDRLNFKTSSIVSSIDESGEYIDTALMDRGRVVFDLKEKNKYPHLRNVKAVIYYLNPYSKRYFTLQTGFSSIDFGSIFLFVNGFRVPPYGDQGDDWLGIEKRKSSGVRRYLSTREVVGRIEINDNNDDFRIITSRSGIVHNDAFEELSREGMPYGFFYNAFRRLERFVVEGIKWDKVDNNKTELTPEEAYLLDDFSRDKQILSVIKKLIDVGQSDIINLNINEDIVQSILDKQVEEAKGSIDTILDNLSEITQNMDIDGLQQYRQKLSADSAELDRLITIVDKLSPDSEKLLEIKAVKKAIAEREDSFNKMETELIAAKQAKIDAEAEALRLSQELAIEKEKNTYLLTSSRTMSEDAKNMVHNIKIISLDIQSEINELLRVTSDEGTSSTEIKESLSLIKFLNEKSLKISKLITRANFKSESDEQIVNVAGYLEQYIGIYKDVVEKCSINIHLNTNGVVYERSISVLDLALIVDNLVSNSQKANAKNIFFEVNQIKDNGITIVVTDDGDGLDPAVQFAPEKIFELGVTTTDGSGIGLFSVRNSLRKIGCDIVYSGVNPAGKGAVFTITIN